MIAAARAWTRRAPRGDDGVTLVELMVVLLGLAILSSIMISAFVATNRVDRHHEADDGAMASLRTTEALITKDLRRAERITVAEAKTVAMWIDENRDGVADEGEFVTWAIESGGALSRATDLGDHGLQAVGLSSTDSSFGYDSPYPDLIRRVSIDLVALVTSPGLQGERRVATEVFLRNGT